MIIHSFYTSIIEKSFNFLNFQIFSEGKRYDVSKFRIPPTPDCTLMLDHLEFEDDDVFNLVIDRAKPEGILVTNDLR